MRQLLGSDVPRDKETMLRTFLPAYLLSYGHDVVLVLRADIAVLANATGNALYKNIVAVHVEVVNVKTNKAVHLMSLGVITRNGIHWELHRTTGFVHREASTLDARKRAIN